MNGAAIPKREFQTSGNLVGGKLYLILFLLAIAPWQLKGQTFTVLHEFKIAKGGNPFDGLITDGKGHFFGTASAGGTSNDGVIFKLSPKGSETVLHNFTGTDGAIPANSLVRDNAGNLYGLAVVGGDMTCYGPYGNPGCGTVFKIDTKGKFSVLHTFTGAPSDGALPSLGGGMVFDAPGNLYGTTGYGGAYNNAGVVFKITPSGQYSIFYNFGGMSGDAVAPNQQMLLIGNEFYGTSSSGGTSGYGTIFKINLNGSESVLFSFGEAGANPNAPLIADSAGNLYGTTEGGIVYEVSPTGSETVLYSFAGGSDGEEPAAGLSWDSAGNLYGTTWTGGTGTNPNCTGGCGTIFKLSQSGGKWTKTTVHSFNQTDGSLPESVLLFNKGSFYGTTLAGGTSTCNYPNDTGCGVVFKLTP